MKYIILILLILLILTGCGATPVKSEPVVVVNKAIVSKCEPTIQITEITEYPTDNMTVRMSLFEKAQLTLAENELLKGQNKELKAALGECTK